MWSKKWYLKRNISCDVHLLNELLEADVPEDDAIVVLAGKMRKLWGSLSELRSSVCERRLERTVLRPALLPVKTAHFTQFFRHVWRHSKITPFNWECIAPLRAHEILQSLRQRTGDFNRCDNSSSDISSERVFTWVRALEWLFAATDSAISWTARIQHWCMLCCYAFDRERKQFCVYAVTSERLLNGKFCCV